MKKPIHFIQALMFLVAINTDGYSQNNKLNLLPEDGTEFSGGVLPDTTWIDLDGTNDFLDLGADNIVAGQTQFTVEMRIHFDNSTGDYTIIGQRTSDVNRTIVLQRWSGSFYVFLSNTNYGSCSFIPCTGMIYHIAIVYDGAVSTNSDKIKLYINGDLQTLAFTGTIDNSSYVTSPAANLVLGCEHNGPATQLQFVDGQIGEFCVWSYPLTQMEVQSRVMSEVYSGSFGLLEYFRFDNGIAGGNNTAITSFVGGKGISTITPTNMAMIGSASNFVGPPVLVSTIDTGVTVFSPTMISNQNSATYQWLDCNNFNTPIPSAVFQNYTATANGSYAVQITLGPCVDTSACITITTIGINELNAENISVYPNPTGDLLHIQSPKIIEHLSILDLTGRMIDAEITCSEGTIDVRYLQPGIYFVQLNVGGSIITKKIVKD